MENYEPNYWLSQSILEDCVEYCVGHYHECDDDLTRQLFLEVTEQFILDEAVCGTIGFPQEDEPPVKVGFWHTLFFGCEEPKRLPLLYVHFETKTQLCQELKKLFSQLDELPYSGFVEVKTSSALEMAIYNQMDARAEFYVKDKVTAPQAIQRIETIFDQHKIAVAVFKDESE